MDISGLEINENCIRAIKFNRAGNNLKIANFAQVQLPEGIIDGGKLINVESFTNILGNFLKANHFSSPRWIVALSEGVVFSTYKTFPNLGKEDLSQAVDINANSLLPGAAEGSFWGWQEIKSLKQESFSEKEVMIASIAKKDLTAYLGAFSKLGIVPIAIEPRSCSIARVFGQIKDTLVLNLEGGILTSVILNEGSVRFAREFTIEAEPKESFRALLSEIRRVTNFYLTENKDTKIENIILDGPSSTPEIARALQKKLNIEVKLAAELVKIGGIALPSLAILGVGIRAMFDPRQDESLSLLPVSAQESSEEKRALMFYRGLANVIVITTFLILLVFWGSWGFLKYLGSQAQSQLNNFISQNLSQTDTDKDIKSAIQELNPLLEKEATLEDQMTYWSPVLSSIQSITPQGITLTQISFTSSGSPLNIVGQAQSREALTSFRDSLSGQSYTESVQLPSTNFSESQNINFTLSLVLKKDALMKSQ